MWKVATSAGLQYSPLDQLKYLSASNHSILNRSGSITGEWKCDIANRIIKNHQDLLKVSIEPGSKTACKLPSHLEQPWRKEVIALVLCWFQHAVIGLPVHVCRNRTGDLGCNFKPNSRSKISDIKRQLTGTNQQFKHKNSNSSLPWILFA
jgi:hypothetical protein